MQTCIFIKICTNTGLGTQTFLLQNPASLPIKARVDQIILDRDLESTEWTSGLDG